MTRPELATVLEWALVCGIVALALLCAWVAWTGALG